MVVNQSIQSALARPPWWIWFLFLVLVALGPGSSKVAGSIWFLMVAAAAGCLFWVPKVTRLLKAEADLLSLSLLWLYFCMAGFLLKAVGMIYWGDPWWTRHFEFRILCAAIAMPIFLARFCLSQAQKIHLAVALFVASVAALTAAYMYAYYGIDTPAQRINWSGGLVMLACIALPLTASPFLSRFKQWMMALATLAFVFAVLLTGSRGPYLALPWVVFGGIYLHKQKLRSVLNINAEGLRLTALMAAVVIALPIALPKIFEVPTERVMLGLAEMHAMVSGSNMNSQAIDTSVGTRVYMWQRSQQMIIESPLIGYGRDQRMAFIQEWGNQVNAEMVTDQTHLHSEYINGMIDHGIFGLLSTLSYMVGAAVLAWKLRRQFPLAAYSLGGIAFTHFVMSFTDTNSQTNNYSVMITVSLLIIFLLTPSKPESSSALIRHMSLNSEK